MLLCWERGLTSVGSLHPFLQAEPEARILTQAGEDAGGIRREHRQGSAEVRRGGEGPEMQPRRSCHRSIISREPHGMAYTMNPYGDGELGEIPPIASSHHLRRRDIPTGGPFPTCLLYAR